MAQVNSLFVCLGNICRSPTAEGVFRKLVRHAGLAGAIMADSAGTSAWHIGNPPDPRAQSAAGRRGVNLSDLCARQAKPQDFDRFRYILAMDRRNYRDLSAIAPQGQEDRFHMLLSFAPGLSETEVPDPYYGGDNGFEKILDMIDLASRGLLAQIRDRDLSSA